jgi:hypothetical protein
VSKLNKLTSADFTDLFGAVDLEELVAVMGNLENGIRGWLLINPRGSRRPTFLSGRESKVMDSGTIEQLAQVQVPGVDRLAEGDEPWVKCLLSALSGQDRLIGKTDFLAPVHSAGRLLAIVGFSGNSRKIGLAASSVSRVVRQIHEMDGLRQDIAGHRFLGLHCATPFVLVTASGRVMGGTGGGLAIMAELAQNDANKGSSPVIPSLLRREIESDGEDIVLGG